MIPLEKVTVKLFKEKIKNSSIKFCGKICKISQCINHKGKY